jgi:hypothetical protein
MPHGDDRTFLNTDTNVNEKFMTTQPPSLSEPSPTELLAQARTAILRNQNPSVALVQRHLKVGYNLAIALMQQLEGDIVSAPDANGQWQLLPTAKLSALPVAVKTSMGVHSLSPEKRAQYQRSQRPLALGNYLQRHREPCPDWLLRFVKGDKFNREQFFDSRMVYYPGSGSDGHAVKLFGAAHCAHCFIYVDYLVKQSHIKADLRGNHKGYNGAFSGYHRLARLTLSESDIAPQGWVQHVQHLERTRFSDDFKPYAFLEVLERDENLGDDHGAHRLAILFLGADGIASYDALFCQKNQVPPPFAVLIQEHGFGGNYDKFGRDGLLERIAHQCQVFPTFLLVAEGSAPWRQYEKMAHLRGSIGGMHANTRFLHKFMGTDHDELIQ